MITNPHQGDQNTEKPSEPLYEHPNKQLESEPFVSQIWNKDQSQFDSNYEKPEFSSSESTDYSKAIKNWTKDDLKTAIYVLGKSNSVKEAANSLGITRRKLQRVFEFHKLKSPALYLPKQTSNIESFDLKKKIEKYELSTLKSDALKWQFWKENVQNDLFKLLQTNVPKYEITKSNFESILNDNNKTSKFAAVLSLQDYHLGRLSSKYEVDDASTDQEKEQQLFEGLDFIIQKLSGFGKSEKLYLGIGGDFLNSDNFKLTTTKGTQQDSFPSHTQLMMDGALLMIRLIDRLRQYFPLIEFVNQNGNHDSTSTVSLYMFLCAWYRNCSDIITNWEQFNIKPRQYRQYGETLLAFMHGDIGAKIKDWPIIFANEAKAFWSQTKYRVAITGHCHQLLTKDENGIIICQMPSMASQDRWSYTEGFQSRKGFSMVIVDTEKGYVGQIFSDHSSK